MPRIKPDEKQIYGSSDLEQKLTFRERLMNRFAAHEWVRVINVDDETFRWQYLPTHAEKFEYTSDPMKATYRDSVEAYELAPGESEVIIGENAYVMIEALYKKVISKHVIDQRPDMPPGNARNFNWTDGAAQEQWIDQIYIGKEQPFREKRAGRPPVQVPPTPKLERKTPVNMPTRKSEYEITRAADK